MIVRLLSAVACSLSLAGAALPAHAQDTLATPAFRTKASPAVKAAGQKPSTARRPGELEGWDNKGSQAAPKATSGRQRPADAISEKPLPDGGLPLPREKASDDGRPPIGFDQNGAMGGAFKF